MASPFQQAPPQLPKNVITAYLFTADTFIRGDDKAISAIRIVDLYSFPRVPAPSPEFQQAVRVQALLTIKIILPDSDKHEVELYVVRPSGGRIRVAVTDAAFSATVPDVPLGFNLIAEIPVITQEEGLHFLTAHLDGDEVARTAFTLREQKPASE